MEAERKTHGTALVAAFKQLQTDTVKSTSADTLVAFIERFGKPSPSTDKLAFVTLKTPNHNFDAGLVGKAGLIHNDALLDLLGVDMEIAVLDGRVKYDGKQVALLRTRNSDVTSLSPAITASTKKTT